MAVTRKKGRSRHPLSEATPTGSYSCPRHCAVLTCSAYTRLVKVIAHLRSRYEQRASWKIASAAIVSILAGCAQLHPTTSVWPDETIPARSFVFADGGHAVYFTFDRILAPSQNVPSTYVFVIPGSDCASFAHWLPRYFRGLEGEAGAIRLFIIHKRFIDARSSDPRNCTPAFEQADHADQWLRDYTEFIERMLASGAAARVVLVGISEGGEVVPYLARHITGVTHVALVASGGMDPWQAFALQTRRRPISDEVNPVLVLSHPEGLDLEQPRQSLAGRTLRYWAELQRLRPTQHLLALDIPVLVAMGEADDAMPVRAALALRERFAAHGKNNLTLLLYPGADHALFDARTSRSRLPDLWHCFELWLDGELPVAIASGD